MTLPDSTRVFPAHGAGSSCGKQLSTETSSTIGEQRRTNYALRSMSEDAFVAAVTEGQPAQPQYFAFEVQRNREVRPLLDTHAPPPLDIDEVLRLRDAGAVLLDAREPADFAAGHLRGAVNVGLQGRFAEWGGDVLAPDRDVVLVGDPALGVEAKVRLGRVGYDRVVGQLSDPAQLFASRPDLIETSSRLTIEQLAELRGLEPGLQVVDVRGPGETEAGTLPGAREIPPRRPHRLVRCAGQDRAGRRVLRERLPLADRRERPARGRLRRCLGPARRLPRVGERGLADVHRRAPSFDGSTTPSVGARGARTLVDARRAAPRRARAGGVAGRARARTPCCCRWDRCGNASTSCRATAGSWWCVARVVAPPPSTDSLRTWGFDAVNLAGGMCAWSSAGLPTETAADEDLVVHRVNPLNCETAIPKLVGGVVMPNARFYVRNHFETAIARRDGLAAGGRRSRRASDAVEPRATCRTCDHSRWSPRSNAPATAARCSIRRSTASSGTSVLSARRSGPACRLARGARPCGCRARRTRRRLPRRRPTVSSSRRATPVPFERSLSLDDARSSEALLAYAMNGEPLPVQHGYPLRLVVPGWYAVTSVKWLAEIELIDTSLEAFFQTERYYFESQRDGATVQGARSPAAGALRDHLPHRRRRCRRRAS